MNTDSVAYQYATALAGLDGVDGTQVENDLLVVRQVFLDNKELRIYYESPRVGSTEKRKAIQNAFGKHIGESTLNLLFLLIDKGREEAILGICDAFVEIMDHKLNRVRPRVIVSREFDKAGIEEIVNLVEQVIDKNRAQFGLGAIQGKIEFFVTTEVDTEILGGISLRIGDYNWDATVSRYLHDWRSRIFARHIEKEQLVAS